MPMPPPPFVAVHMNFYCGLCLLPRSCPCWVRDYLCTAHEKCLCCLFWSSLAYKTVVQISTMLMCLKTRVLIVIVLCSSLPIPMLAVCCETNASAAHIYTPPPPQLVKDKSKIQVHSSQDCFLYSFWKQQSHNFFAIILESLVLSSRFHRDIFL